MALLGPSGSGKSALSIELAQEVDAEIFSLDSLSIYKDINIASAKPSLKERKNIKHYALDHLNIDEKNNAQLFKTLLEDAMRVSSKEVLLIVGGSSFYLKSILEGLSDTPKISGEEVVKIEREISALADPYAFLKSIDPTIAFKIHPNDTYRIRKALEIFYATHTPPSEYFKANPKKPFEHAVSLFALSIEKSALHNNIKQRTKNMLHSGLIEEIKALYAKYPKDSQPFKAIGVKESVLYLEKRLTLKGLEEAIVSNTMKLAKRQNTFNKTQFNNLYMGSVEEIRHAILKHSKSDTRER
ncbi:tRNA (adenosine(37)-N6)-dimethylallyltransferase MiaA [Helicobacter pylori]|uniref:tRNA (adenosine(37)-N6)-dimethylallyltransferase MiaA n=1 Tax=Helicobacter pylori TaxID=210 RepID=UPI000994809C|nr:tRNA (adenosine(37)-N6)-dimethylallyltransferase MiaA [Helicobacter pylori]OOP99138.1 tRNA (adenosine(37)-N6)-dimethylallyltransferase MiaA [Helicobacter pylori]OOQ07682.1 tRNA (adenosine(37)-N6)-dimethylallyltransferase MiaA [Helicobacter pylori]RPF61021.1 tRNA (adenosine(37)-N6)-dimethylallyltransferase MiaA [Helicobacter pylori]WQU63161.1 tRNA (adenosine(37)-N6)-dimethylallyltransferase MiaA [Helicobacter pylori]WQU76138.1 tRNA (adenosine(37)-N6)-dimethylallyltransferase MiaA [Helicobact